MKTVKFMKEIFFIFAMISLFMAVGNMTTFSKSAPGQDKAALIFGILFVFFLLLSVFFKWIQEKNRA